VKAAELGIPLGTHRDAQFSCDDVLIPEHVPAERGQPSSVRGTGPRTLGRLLLAQ
jgi:hypothetical protein